MKSVTIQTRYRPPSHSGRKAKIECHCSNGTKAFYCYDDSIDSIDNHRESAMFFCEDNNLECGPYLKGSKLPLGGWVFISGEIK